MHLRTKLNIQLQEIDSNVYVFAVQLLILELVKDDEYAVSDMCDFMQPFERIVRFLWLMWFSIWLSTSLHLHEIANLQCTSK